MTPEITVQPNFLPQGSLSGYTIALSPGGNHGRIFLNQHFVLPTLGVFLFLTKEVKIQTSRLQFLRFNWKDFTNPFRININKPRI